MTALFPHPGVLPSLPEPAAGEQIVIEVQGLPPYKDEHFSIRNPRHPLYGRFALLREAAIAAMAGRKWLDGPVRMSLTLFAPKLDRPLLDYAAGIEDTLDGSHGEQFTYLPIAFQDDCQVCHWHSEFVSSETVRYVVVVTGLEYVGETTENGRT